MTTNPNPATDQYILVNGLRLHYLEWGRRGDPAVIMVHGLTGNAHVFDQLAGHFADNYHVLSLDARGHGDSEWDKDGNYFTEAHVSDLEGLRQALGFQRVSLIGTSMGGRICMAYAGLYPDRVDRLVVNDIGPEVAPQGGRLGGGGGGLPGLVAAGAAVDAAFSVALSVATGGIGTTPTTVCWA